MTKRIRGRQLQRIRQRVLLANPCCVRCLERGFVTLAVQVDHVQALTNDGAEDPHDDANRQPLCRDCHKAKTDEDMGRAPVRRTGCDSSGRPADPQHPWNRSH